MSDSNYIYVKAGGTPVVYRNSINGNLFSSLTNITTSVPLGGETNGLNSVCCNADNSVNLISNGASGGSIFRSTTWDGAFTKVANTNVGGWMVISTSSAGNIVCACTQTAIYIYQLTKDKHLPKQLIHQLQEYVMQVYLPMKNL